MDTENQRDSMSLTDAEWREFQSIPDQGYSHRAWIDARITERAAAPDALRERIAAIEHDDWCDANGCRCGKCPCLGAPWCVIPPEPTTD